MWVWHENAQTLALGLAAPRALWLVCALCIACADTGVNDPQHGDAGASSEAGSEIPAADRSLVDHTQWRRFEVSRDPLASHQPEQIECGIAGWLIERGKLEVDTGRCNYLLVEHPSLHAVAEGTQVSVELFYYDLTAPEPAEAHLALLFDDALQWETTLSIPRPADVITARFKATRALAEGEPIRLHLHNHGQNTWTLVSVEAGGDDAARAAQ